MPCRKSSSPIPTRSCSREDGLTKADLAGVLRVGGGGDAPARPRPAAEPVALERGHRRQARRPAGHPQGRARLGASGSRRRGARAARIEHVLCQDADTLRWLANQNCITPHVWSARRDRLDRPDRIVFDFDPEEGSDFALVREARAGGRRAAARAGAGAVRDGHRLQGHPRGGADQAHARARRGCASGRGRSGAEIAERSPDTLTTEWRKEKRDGRILVDTARNTYGQTVVAPYAVRALPGAPVATPLDVGGAVRPGAVPRARGRCARWASGSPGAAIRGRTSPTTRPRCPG